MTFYLAAPYELKAIAHASAQDLVALGHKVSSTWHSRDDENTEETALRDLAEVEEADALILFNPSNWGSSGTGGRHVEFGYALARDKNLIIVGARTNLFHQFETIRVIDGLEDL